MPATPVYGLPFEQYPSDQPGHTLYGGSSGTELILAEEVETELVRIDSDISDLQAAVVEAGLGWVPIDSGVFIGAPPFTVDLTAGGAFPAGTFSCIRVRGRGDMDGSPGQVTMRINDDTTVDLHEYAWIRRLASDGSTTQSDWDAATFWRIGRFTTLTASGHFEATIFNTDTSNQLVYRSVGGSLGSTAAGSATFEAWGRLAASRLASSLRFNTTDAAVDFGRLDWEIEGYRTS